MARLYHGIIGNGRPVAGLHFPRQIAAFLELQGAAIGHTLVRIECPDRASKYPSHTRERMEVGHHLQVNSGTGPKRSIRLHQGASSTHIEHAYGVARTKCGSCRFVAWPSDAYVAATIA
jgi:hypothetical protein